MSDLASLYQELILDHARHPRGRGLTGTGVDSHQHNPICGDDVTVRVSVEGGALSMTWEGEGCSISQASASMLSELADGMPTTEAAALVDGFRAALRSRGTLPLDEEVYGDAAALSGVSRYSARVKCAMLAWVGFEDALARS